jgi:hypothetical protein
MKWGFVLAGARLKLILTNVQADSFAANCKPLYEIVG